MRIFTKQNQVSNPIGKLYKELVALKSYYPSKRVNYLFTQLVQYVLNPESKNIFSEEEVRKLQKICQTAEYEMEKFWAHKIIQSKNHKKTMQDFPYIENYRKLTQLEWFSLLSCTTHKTHSICFIGGGPLPLTAIILAQKYAQTITILDKDRLACKIAKKLVERLNLGNKITIIEADGSQYKDYKMFNVIMVAALAGMDRTGKEKIMLKIKQCAHKEAHILARSSWGMRKLLYRPLDQGLSRLFNPIMEVRPQNDVINSVVIFKNSSTLL